MWVGVGEKLSYCTLGCPAKLKNLHSKIGRRVDLARVRYGTMQSERRRRIICAHLSARGNQVLGGDGNLCFLFFVYDVVPKGGWKESNVGVRRRS